jgi:hypothetical protein
MFYGFCVTQDGFSQWSIRATGVIPSNEASRCAGATRFLASGAAEAETLNVKVMGPKRSRSRWNLMVTLIGAWLLFACTNPEPQLAQGLPQSFGPSSDFDRRIKSRFPIDSDESALSLELRRERFTMREATSLEAPYAFAASYDRREFPCRQTWTVLWNSKVGKISAIVGRYSGEMCL